MKATTRFAAGLALATLSSSAFASVDQIPGSPCIPAADSGLSDRDTYRIEHLTSARTAGLAAAMNAANAEDRAVVSSIYEGGLSPITMMPEGPYKCRTIKLGGTSDLVIYQWFQCAVASENGALTLTKVTGSQNFLGTLTPAGSGLLYKGALFYGDEAKPKAYGEDPERDQVGCVTKDFEDGTRFVLELPWPVFESTHDVIELMRTN